MKQGVATSLERLAKEDRERIENRARELNQRARRVVWFQIGTPSQKKRGHK